MGAVQAATTSAVICLIVPTTASELRCVGGVRGGESMVEAVGSRTKKEDNLCQEYMNNHTGWVARVYFIQAFSLEHRKVVSFCLRRKKIAQTCSKECKR